MEAHWDIYGDFLSRLSNEKSVILDTREKGADSLIKAPDDLLPTLPALDQSIFVKRIPGSVNVQKVDTASPLDFGWAHPCHHFLKKFQTFCC